MSRMAPVMFPFGSVPEYVNARELPSSSAVTVGMSDAESLIGYLL